VHEGQRGRFRSGITAAVAVAVVGLAASGTAAILVHNAEWRTARVNMGRGTAAIQTAVQAELRRYVDASGLVAAGIGALETVTPAGFEAATAPLVGLNLRGVAAVAFMAPSSGDRVAATEATWRARGLPDLTLRPQGGGPHFFAVLQRVLDGSPRTDGADLSPIAEPADALNRARQSGTTTVSEPYLLLRDRGQPTAGRQRAVIFATPVTDRNGTFQGWVIIGVRAENLMARLLQSSVATRLDISVHAGADPVPLARLIGIGTGPTELTGRAPLVVADRQWTLRVDTDRATLPGANSDLDRGIAAGGTAATLLLAVLVYVVSTGRRRLAAKVTAVTAEARAAEREATRQAGLLGAVMDSIGDGVVVVDGDGRFLMVNPAARALVGDPVESTPANHYGLYRSDGVTPFDLDEMPLIRALHGEYADHVDIVARNHRHPDGVRLNVSTRPLDPRAGQPGAVAVFHDVTERQAAEEAVRRLNAELEDRVAARTAELALQTEQLRAANAELEAFSYSVSHDLRAPLRAVDGFARMLELDHAPHLDETGRRYVARVRAGAQTMGDLIDGLLAFSRLQRQELTYEEVRLDVLVAEVWDELAPDREGRRVELEVGHLPFAMGDRRLLRQVVANLLHNALKYTRGRETAIVTVGHGNGAYFVKDNGAGFDPRYADRLFQVFQRLHRAEDYEGTGVGLALASRIVLRHGGRIWAEGAVDGGATFHFTLQHMSAARPRRTPANETEEATDVVHADAGAAGRG
jgi:PAS domain S-box-containing protein